MDELDEYPQVFEGIVDHVHAASHKIALLTGETTRPYGFIMRATLEDSLPCEGWQRDLEIDIRLCLQVSSLPSSSFFNNCFKLIQCFLCQYMKECISLYMNWRFEFSTVYPPPVQAQNTRLAKLSIFYESMLESLMDFRVILVIALELLDKIQTKIISGQLSISSFFFYFIPSN
jgi:hypothetical protein